MGLIDTLLGPKSKYDSSLPYTYEARVNLIEGTDETISYFSDTICGLIEHLHQQDVGPSAVRIFEIYTDRELPIDATLFVDTSGQWLFKPDICRTFEKHYRGHIHGQECSFSDRDRSGT